MDYPQRRREQGIGTDRNRKRSAALLNRMVSLRDGTRSTAADLHAPLAALQSRSLHMQTYVDCAARHTIADEDLCDVYAGLPWRLNRFRAAFNALREEARFLRTFECTFGPPDPDLIVAFGSWAEHPQALRGNAPGWVRGGMRALARRGYYVMTVDEAYTSKACSRPGCGGSCQYSCIETKTLQWQGDARGWRPRRVWKLSRCSLCHMIYHRDWNAARNGHAATMARLGHPIDARGYDIRPRDDPPRSQTRQAKRNRRQRAEAAARAVASGRRRPRS